MSQKRPRSKPVGDRHVAILAAEAFRASSAIFTATLPDDPAQAVQIASKNIGGLIASATSRALAVELYLKALRIALGLPVPTTHHLWSLYKSIPSEHKFGVEEIYDSYNAGIGLRILGLNIMVEVEEDPVPVEERKPPPYDGEDLKSVLLRSSDAFVNWRYLHQGGRPGEPMYYTYDFRRLDFVCDALRDYINKVKDKASR
jgi:hypothetical protein